VGNLSEHFSYRDFACKCKKCKSEVKIHLGLVGALEAISANFRRVPRIVDAYRCEDSSNTLVPIKKDSHRQGRAVHIYIDGVPLNQLFEFVKTLPEIRGIGYYQEEGILHIDTRQSEKDQQKDIWVKENGKILPLTPDLKSKYNLR